MSSLAINTPIDPEHLAPSNISLDKVNHEKFPSATHDFDQLLGSEQISGVILEDSLWL